MAKFSLYTIIIWGLVLISCGNRHEGEERPTLLSNLLSISNNEDKGVKEILSFYGGYCKYAIGYSASTREGKKKYFELEISKSDIIEKYKNVVEMPASNIAYLFYRNLKNEKNNYDEIHTVIIFKDKSKVTLDYSKETLAIVDNKMNVVEKLVNLLKRKNYEGIKPFLKPDTTYIHYDKDELVSNLTKVELQLGTIKEFLPYGFRFNDKKDQQAFLHISGVLLRDKQSNEFSVDIDPKSTNDEIILLQYKL